MICSSLRASLNITARSQHQWDTTLCVMRLSQQYFLRFSYSRVVQLFPGPSSYRDEGTRILRNVDTTHPLTRRHISRRDPIRYRAASQLCLRQTPSAYDSQILAVQKQEAAACLRNFLALISATPYGPCRTTNALRDVSLSTNIRRFLWHEI